MNTLILQIIIFQWEPFLTYNQVVTVNGVSKSFAMTGWRLGYIGAPEWLAKACTKIQGQFTSGTSSISKSSYCSNF